MAWERSAEWCEFEGKSGFNGAVSALGAEAIPGEAGHGHSVRRTRHELIAIHIRLVRGAQNPCESELQHEKRSSELFRPFPNSSEAARPKITMEARGPSPIDR